MEFLLEGSHHGEDYILVIVVLKRGEIQISRKPPLASEKHFPQASAALEGQPVKNAALREKLKQKGQHDFLLGDHHVAKTGLSGVAPHVG